MVISTANRSSALAVGALLSIGVGSIAAAYYWKLSNQEEYSKAILSLIKRRRSIFPKQFSGEPVDRKILEEMLEAARWAPTHNVTQPWKFVVFSSHESKAGLGSFLANLYKEACATRGWTFSEAKYKKYDSKVQKASFVVALLCDFGQGKNPPFEEICSVAMAVQNMHLVATAHGVGQFFSSQPKRALSGILAHHPCSFLLENHYQMKEPIGHLLPCTATQKKAAAHKS
eukprot:scaffold22850_cov179-Cylindrotheca_fusiformis.AAC.1